MIGVNLMEQSLPTHYFLIRQSRREGWDWIITTDSAWLDYGRAVARWNDLIRHRESLGEKFGVEQFHTWKGVTNHWMRTSDAGWTVELSRFEFERVYDWDALVPGMNVETGAGE